MKIDCDIIRDLLPLYAEGMVSEKSKTAVERHLAECDECRKVYEKMREPGLQVRYDTEPAESFRKYVKKNKRRLMLKTALVTAAVVLVVVAIRLAAVGGLIAFLAIDSGKAEIYEDTNADNYLCYMGETAREEYADKWNMKEEIFPEAITEEMQAVDYKMVYYDPWDAQYLSYLVVEYGEEAYHTEVERLQDYNSTEYLGYYGAAGFAEGYELLAMEADPYHGFVYALGTGDARIVYVELIFCNYFMDLDYEGMIPKEYLPAGFDAGKDNLYRKQALGED